MAAGGVRGAEFGRVEFRPEASLASRLAAGERLVCTGRLSRELGSAGGCGTSRSARVRCRLDRFGVGCRRLAVPGFVQRVEQLLLGLGDGLSVEGGYFGGGAGLLDGAFGFGGQKGAIALGVGVSFGDGGGDARGAGVSGLRGFGAGRSGGLGAVAAVAVGGQALGNLVAEGLR